MDDYLKSLAEKKYKEENADWEAKLKTEEDRYEERLRDPKFLESQGLPTKLPQSTIDILKVTMAIDRIGPQKPQVDKIYTTYGL